MRKYISLIALPVFLVVSSFILSTQIEHAAADVPVESCPTGSMRLTYGDGSTTATGGLPQPSDPWAPAPAPAPNPAPAPAPAPINWNRYIQDDVIDKYNRNPRFNEQRNINQNTLKSLTTKVYAQEEESDDAPGRGQGPLGGGPRCASWANFDTNAAQLACIVMQEQGGGPFCLSQATNTIYNGLTDTSCRKHPGTQLAGFKIVSTFPTYACGVPSPITDG